MTPTALRSGEIGNRQRVIGFGLLVHDESPMAELAAGVPNSVSVTFQ
jgi:hypothetical protein